MKYKVQSMIVMLIVLSCSGSALGQEQTAKAYWHEFIESLSKIERISYKATKTVVSGREDQKNIISKLHVWLDKDKYKTQVKMDLNDKDWGAVTITHPEGSYLKEQGSNIFKKFEKTPVPTIVDLLTATMPGTDTTLSEFRILGQEELNGEEVTVIERVTPFAKTSYIDTFWIANSTRLLLKHKNEWAHGYGMHTITEFNDYSFDEIAEDVFNVGDNWIDGRQEDQLINQKFGEKVKQLQQIEQSKDGVYKEYFENGTLKSESVYEKGRLITGKTYFPNGNLWVGEDREKGQVREYYKDGTLRLETFGEEGKSPMLAEPLNRTMLKYHPNGKLSLKRVVKDGKIISEEKFDEQGNLNLKK